MASQAGPVSALAERYATALLELAEEQRALDGVAEDLEALKALLEGSPELTHLARSPLIAREDRARAMQAVAERAGFSDLTRNFIGVVARHGRLFALQAIAERFLAVLAERRGEVTAEVTVAHALDDAQRRSLEAALGGIAGGRVSIDLRVDPDILGGLVVRLGSRLFDSSLGSRLRRLELSMKGA
ncbi:MAG: F0F1 ATP synthase subunit delta [Alphaproteobacteria bacterium]|nr:F0F1 ATP synthase subunit delta [Alphaproteobacteria bacterium]